MDLTLTFDAAYVPHAAVVLSTVAEQHPGVELRYWLIAADDVSAALPAGVDRVLYLDCDTMCTGDLTPLSTVDMQGKPLGAVIDPFNKRLYDMGGIPGLSGYTHLDPRAFYFNSGVLLIDVPRWKEAEVTEVSLSYLGRHAHESRYPDQDALNFAVYGNWLALSKRWNNLKAWRLEPEFGGSLAEASIIHPAGPVKPWQPGFPKGARRDLYWAHRRRSGGRTAATRPQTAARR